MTKTVAKRKWCRCDRLLAGNADSRSHRGLLVLGGVHSQDVPEAHRRLQTRGARTLIESLRADVWAWEKKRMIISVGRLTGGSHCLSS